MKDESRKTTDFFFCDETRCRHDGICVKTCPVGILEMDPQRHIPVPVEGARERCIVCGHCIAVCPHQAVSLATMPVSQCEEIKESLRLSPEQLEQLLKARRSIRRYKTDPVDKSIIEEVLDTARYAPSGINLQPVSWIVIQDPRHVHQVAGLVIEWMKNLIIQQHPLSKTLNLDVFIQAWKNGEDFVCRHAPHLVIAYGLKDDMTAPQAATIALTYFELAAAVRGLGTCWDGYVHMAAMTDPAVKKALGLRSRESCLGAMLLGYPQYGYARIPLRNPARIKWLD